MAFFKTSRDQLKANDFLSNLELAKATFQPNDFYRATLHINWAYDALLKMRRARAGYVISREGWLYASDICFELANGFSQVKEGRLSDLCLFMYQWALWSEDQIGEGGVLSRVRSSLGPRDGNRRSPEPQFMEPEFEEADLEDDAETRIKAALDNHAVGLDLSDLELTSVPESFAMLRSLQTLSICRTPLASLPETIGNLTDLKELYIYDNQLTSLPESIGNLINLETISAGRNQLQSLPEFLGRLVRLERLYVEHNRLTRLPESLANLTNLRTIDVSGNLLAGPLESFGDLGKLIEGQLLDQEHSS
jgi:hypothetical protein